MRTGPSVTESLDRMYATVYGPVRHELAGGYEGFYEDPGELTIAADLPIHFRNREANVGGASSAIAGEHYVAVSMNVSGSGALGVEQPFEIGVRLDGSPGSGPEWEPVNEPGPTPSSPIGTGDDAPDGEATGGEGDDDEDSSLVAAPDENSVLPGWALPAGIGVVLLVLGDSGCGSSAEAGPADPVRRAHGRPWCR